MSPPDAVDATRHYTIPLLAPGSYKVPGPRQVGMVVALCYIA